MSNLKLITDDEEFEASLAGHGDELVIIDFFTTWCRPCKTMEPVFEAMAIHYPKALFLRVDADKCFETAMKYQVSGVPFFVIYYNRAVVEKVQGANPQELELKIRLAEIECRKAAAAAVDRSKSSVHSHSVNPTMSTFGKLGAVTQYIDHENSHCLNDLSPTSFHTFIQGKKLVSGRGTGKMLIVYSFTQKMMLQSFKIKANPQTGPKILRFFVNHPKVLDFNVGSTLAPSQEVVLSSHDLTGDRAIELRSGSFQVVTNVQIFVTSGQTSKNPKIEIESLQLFGAPILGIQPILGVDSLIASSKPSTARPTTCPIFNGNEKNSKPGSACPSCPYKSSSNDNNSDLGNSDSRIRLQETCQGSSCCTKQFLQEQEQQRVSQHHQRTPHSNPNANANYTAAQLPGHSKYRVQDGNEDQPNNDDNERLRHHHHKPQPGDKDHHHHHSHSRHE